MKVLLSLLALAIMCSVPAAVSAQTLKQPAQIAASSDLREPVAVAPTDTSSAYAPKTTIAHPDDSHTRIVNRIWISSMVAAVAGTSLDAATSWGQREENGFLASSDGRFGAKGLSIKAAFAAAVIIPQICLRKHNELKGAFAAGNFVEAGIFAGVSVHNLQVRSANTH